MERLDRSPIGWSEPPEDAANCGVIRRRSTDPRGGVRPPGRAGRAARPGCRPAPTGPRRAQTRCGWRASIVRSRTFAGCGVLSQARDPLVGRTPHQDSPSAHAVQRCTARAADPHVVQAAHHRHVVGDRTSRCRGGGRRGGAPRAPGAAGTIRVEDQPRGDRGSCSLVATRRRGRRVDLAPRVHPPGSQRHRCRDPASPPAPAPLPAGGTDPAPPTPEVRDAPVCGSDVVGGGM